MTLGDVPGPEHSGLPPTKHGFLYSVQNQAGVRMRAIADLVSGFWLLSSSQGESWARLAGSLGCCKPLPALEPQYLPSCLDGNQLRSLSSSLLVLTRDPLPSPQPTLR